MMEPVEKQQSTFLVGLLKEAAFFDPSLGYCWCKPIRWQPVGLPKIPHSDFCQRANAAIADA